MRLIVSILFGALLQSQMCAINYSSSTAVEKDMAPKVIEVDTPDVAGVVEVPQAPKAAEVLDAIDSGAVVKAPKVIEVDTPDVAGVVEVPQAPKAAEVLDNKEIAKVVPEDIKPTKVVVKVKPKSCTKKINDIYSKSKEISDLILKKLAKNSNKSRADTVMQEVSPHFDKAYAARRVMGSHYKQLQDIGKVALFEDLLIGRILDQYADAIGMISRSTKIILSKRKVDIVSADLVEVGGRLKVKNKWLKLNYDLHCNSKVGQWQVYDISIDGISIIKNYKSQVVALIKQSGSVEGMLGAFK